MGAQSEIVWGLHARRSRRPPDCAALRLGADVARRSSVRSMAEQTLSTASTPALRWEDNVAIIDFGNGENVMGDTWVAQIHALLDQFDQREGPKALVTWGSGKFYSNGLDTDYIATVDVDEFAAYFARVCTLLYRIALLGAPTCAAVNGHAFGMGAFFAIAHDQAVMREDRGYICFPEVNIGMSIPQELMEVGRMALSPRALRRVLTSGTRYGGPDAVAVGLVDSAAPLEALVAQAIERVAPLTTTAGPTLATIKRQLGHGLTKVEQHRPTPHN